MTEYPILFSDPLVRAILDGRKTQTRRPIKPTWAPCTDRAWLASTPSRAASCCPFGAVGDRLWVRECFKPWPDSAGAERKSCVPNGHRFDMWERSGVIYRSTWTKSAGARTWKPSIHMPRWASRITLEITGIRVERVQDISEGDARAEGMPWTDGDPDEHGLRRSLQVYARKEFALAWDAIYGQREGLAWGRDPWVWVIEFKRVEAS